MSDWQFEVSVLYTSENSDKVGLFSEYPCISIHRFAPWYNQQSGRWVDFTALLVLLHRDVVATGLPEFDAVIHPRRHCGQARGRLSLHMLSFRRDESVY